MKKKLQKILIGIITLLSVLLVVSVVFNYSLSMQLKEAKAGLGEVRTKLEEEQSSNRLEEIEAEKQKELEVLHEKEAIEQRKTNQERRDSYQEICIGEWKEYWDSATALAVNECFSEGDYSDGCGVRKIIQRRETDDSLFQDVYIRDCIDRYMSNA